MDYGVCMPLDLTAVIINKNGRATLKACIESLRWCPHILVADDASSDDSVRIARELRVDTIRLRVTQSFAQKRNEALSYVRTSWVLFIDVDEVVSSTLQVSITKALHKESTINGYYIKRDDVFMGKALHHGETGNMWLLRLARKDNGKWKRSVHEVWDIKGKTEKLMPGSLLHTPHPTLESFFEKVNRYTDEEVHVRTRHGTPSYFILFTQLILFPKGKFLYNFFYLRGYEDGFVGLCHAYCMSLYSLVVRIKMIEFKRK
jgi:glycosyltransferase involved in cell wall biosynthesis